ncbi:MAG: M20/M25/M40 family metallo-hydrolase [Armatimonadota bacterium]|nr:M20/M25/M40 family metallo-hydrolase [Armatimonadota bacterium]
MFRSYLFLCAAALGAGAYAQGDPSVISTILDEGKNRNQVMTHLRHLTTQIGHRLTGSHSLQAACEWTRDEFKRLGLVNANLEQWGEVPVGFQREQTGHVGRMVLPTRRDFQFTTRSWTPGTNGLMKGPAVAQPADLAAIETLGSKLKGAWVMMKPAAGGRRGGGQRPSADFMQALRMAGASGTVTSSSNELVVTSGSWANLDFLDLPRDVSVMVRKSDYDAVMKELDAGKDVQLEFNVRQKFFKGPVPIYNVVAEIRGTEKPDEVVIVSGHLDSWDGPGSQGTCDNGTGTMVALEAARILMKAGAKPKRTIRFIMWTGEEQGLHGSRRYVQLHQAELDKISAVLVDDGGTNFSGGLVAIADMEPMLRAAISPVATFFPDMPVNLVIRDTMPRGGGSDHAPFNQVGVPGFFWNETGRANYTHVHHTQHDSIDQAIPEYLVQSSTVTAVVAYNLACADTMLPRQKAN